MFIPTWREILTFLGAVEDQELLGVELAVGEHTATWRAASRSNSATRSAAGRGAHAVPAAFSQRACSRSFVSPYLALSTQLYIDVAALTTLLLSAVVSERERSSRQLAEAKLLKDQGAAEERHRIARDLHDSVSQTLFSTVLHTRSAQKALGHGDSGESVIIGRDLDSIGELTRSAQGEMRALISELGHDPVAEGLLAALKVHAAEVAARDDLTVQVHGPEDLLPLSHAAEAQLFGMAREALSNVIKHAAARSAWVSVESPGEYVTLEIRDDGRGFNPAVDHPGHYGLDSMRSRAAEVGAVLTIASEPGPGSVVHVEVPHAR